MAIRAMYRRFIYIFGIICNVFEELLRCDMKADAYFRLSQTARVPWP